VHNNDRQSQDSQWYVKSHSKEISMGKKKKARGHTSILKLSKKIIKI